MYVCMTGSVLHILYLYCIYVCGYIGGMAISLCMYDCMTLTFIFKEPVYPHGPLRLPIDDNVKLTAAEYRDRLYQEISNRRRESRHRQTGQVHLPCGAYLSFLSFTFLLALSCKSFSLNILHVCMQKYRFSMKCETDKFSYYVCRPGISIRRNRALDLISTAQKSF